MVVGRLKREGVCVYLGLIRGFPGGSVGKNLPAKQQTWLQSLVWKDPLEKEMATAVFLLEKPHRLVGYSPRVAKSQTQLTVQTAAAA